MARSTLSFFIFAFVVFLANGCRTFVPNDEFLIENFKRNRVEFEKLITMIREDERVISVSRDGSVLDINYNENRGVISEPRLAEYITLLKKVNAISVRIFLGSDNSRLKFSSIDVSVWEERSWSIVGGGCSKSYVFSDVEKKPTTASLDVLSFHQGDVSQFRQISENWYLYLDIW